MNQIMPIKDSFIEVKIQNFLKQLGIDFLAHQYIKDIEHGYQCDIYIPVQEGIIQKTIIECDGDYWHNYPNGREIDNIRTKELIEKGFKIIRLWEREIKLLNLENLKRKL
jgi:G:T-mismatch repair DNA endonuclease (very short patch repair protein)